MQILPTEQEYSPSLRFEHLIRVEEVCSPSLKLVTKQDNIREQARISMCIKRCLGRVGAFRWVCRVGVLILDYEDVATIHAAGDKAKGSLHEWENASVAGVHDEMV